MYINPYKKHLIKEMYKNGFSVDYIMQYHNVTYDVLKLVVQNTNPTRDRSLDKYELHKLLFMTFPVNKADTIERYLNNRSIKTLSALRLAYKDGLLDKCKHADDIRYLMSDIKNRYLLKANYFPKKFVRYFIERDAYDCLDFLVDNGFASLECVYREINDIVNFPNKYVNWRKETVVKLTEVLDCKNALGNLNDYNYHLLSSLSHLVFHCKLNDCNMMTVKQLSDILRPYSTKPSNHKYTLKDTSSLICTYLNKEFSQPVRTSIESDTLVFILTLLFSRQMADYVITSISDRKTNLRAVVDGTEILLLQGKGMPVQKLLTEI